MTQLRCPAPGTESDEQRSLGLIGCGSINVIGPDDESLYDCLDCGLWFTVEAVGHPWSALSAGSAGGGFDPSGCPASEGGKRRQKPRSPDRVGAEAVAFLAELIAADAADDAETCPDCTGINESTEDGAGYCPTCGQGWRG